MLWDLAQFLAADDFEQLGRRLELSTGDEIGLLVSGEAGSLDYGSQAHDFQMQTVEQAVRWLALPVPSEARARLIGIRRATTTLSEIL